MSKFDLHLAKIVIQFVQEVGDPSDKDWVKAVGVFIEKVSLAKSKLTKIADLRLPF